MHFNAHPALAAGLCQAYRLAEEMVYEVPNEAAGVNTHERRIFVHGDTKPFHTNISNVNSPFKIPSADIFAVHNPRGKFQRKFHPIPSKQLSALLRTLQHWHCHVPHPTYPIAPGIPRMAAGSVFIHCLISIPLLYIVLYGEATSIWVHVYKKKRVHSLCFASLFYPNRNNRTWHGGTGPKTSHCWGLRKGKPSSPCCLQPRRSAEQQKDNLLSYRHIIATSDTHENNAVSQRSVVSDTASNFLWWSLTTLPRKN